MKNDPSVLPTPWRLVPLFQIEIRSGQLFYHLSATLVRVIVTFVCAMTIGTILGFLLGRYPRLNRWFDPWLTVFLNIPALVTIVLVYLWVGLNEVAAVLAVSLNKIPNVAVIIREGVRALDPKYDEMAEVFHISTKDQARHVWLPQLAPFFAASARSGIALIWKIVLVVEFLGRSDGVGFQIHVYFQLFEVGMVLVYAMSFIGIMLGVEALLLRPLERRAAKWRQS
ncbi:MAG: ABC transporter permease [Marinosulfonomonas sp.]